MDFNSFINEIRAYQFAHILFTCNVHCVLISRCNILKQNLLLFLKSTTFSRSNFSHRFRTQIFSTFVLKQKIKICQLCTVIGINSAVYI